MKHWIKAATTIAALAAVALGTAEAKDFAGKAKKGENECTENFIYDTGNALPGSVISIDCAVALGLGTKATAEGVTTFTPTAGQGATGPFNINNGAYQVYCFTDIEITCTDSRGVECSFTDEAYVAVNNSGANRVIAGSSILNQDWINGVMALLRGAGDAARGEWGELPQNTQGQPQQPADAGQSSSDVQPDNDPGAKDGSVRALGFGTNPNPVPNFWMYGSAFKNSYLSDELAFQIAEGPSGEIDPIDIDPDEFALLPAHGVDPFFVLSWLDNPFPIPFIVAEANLDLGGPACPIVMLVVPFANDLTFRGVGHPRPNAIIGGTALDGYAHNASNGAGAPTFVNYNPGATLTPLPPPCSIADLDGNAFIDVFDLILFLQNFNPNNPNCQGVPIAP